MFKSVFQQPENAAAELQHVPAERVAAIDWSTLKLEPGSYVDLLAGFFLVAVFADFLAEPDIVSQLSPS